MLGADSGQLTMFNFFTKTAYTFEGKKDQENVVIFVHRHWYTIVNKVSVLLALSLVPLLLLIVFGQVILEYKLIPLYTFLWSVYIMVLWMFLFYILTMYTLDYWIVTDERIVDNKQMGFFNRKISELSIHMIQDISVRLVGFVPTLLNFGNVEVQTAAEQGNFFFENIPNPQLAKDKIMQIIEKTEDELGPRMHGMVQRHHFHPESKYADQRTAVKQTTENLDSSHTKEVKYMAPKSPEQLVEESMADQEREDDMRNSRNSESYDDNDNQEEGSEDNIPPNLPI